MFQFNAKFAFHVLQISIFYFWSMFCLKRIALIFACRAVNIQIEFLAAKYLRNVLAGARWCYTRWYHVSTHQSWYVIYNCTPIIIPGFLAPAGRHTIYIFVPPTFRYLVRPRNIDVNCHPRSVFVLFRCESAALFTHSCRVSPRSEGSDDGFIYTALGPPIISKIITNFENVFQFADVRSFLWCPTCPNLAQIHCNLLWVSYNLASLRQVGETRELRITPFLASFILVAVRLELDKLFSVLTSC